MTLSAVQSLSDVSAVASGDRAIVTAGWQAQLHLRFVARGDRTVLAHRRHVGPLMIQRAFYPEPDVCHAYIVHPPGGVVGSDELRIEVDVDSRSTVLLTTPAASKFYRSSGATARQSQTLRVDSAALEWLPQESIYYPDARVRSETLVRLNGDSRFVGWEVACLGLPARGEAFDRGRLGRGFELDIDGVPRFIDRLGIDGGDAPRSARWGLGGHTAIGTMLIYPATREMVEIVRKIECAAAALAVSRVDDVLVCRCLGVQAEPVRRTLIEIWKTIRPALLGRTAVLPRIW